MNLNREQIFLIIIILIIVISGSVIIIQNTFRKNELVAVGLTEKNEKPEENELKEDLVLREKKEKKEEEDIYVHITGSVKKPGVYKLKKNNRIVDALEAAGGSRADADLKRINLAERISDGEQIYIPGENDPLQKKDLSQATTYDHKNKVETEAEEKTGKININSAGEKQLEELPGIGPSKARNIVEYRKIIGKFTEYEQLLSVNGIGEKTLEKMKGELSLN